MKKPPPDVTDVVDDRFQEQLPWNFAIDPETGEVYQVSASLDSKGREIPDPIPMAPAVKATQADALIDMVRRMVRTELSRAAEEAGAESFEEAEDFDVPDDIPDPKTPYEAVFDPPLRLPEPPAPPPSGGGGAEPPSGAPSSAGEPAPPSPVHNT